MDKYSLRDALPQPRQSDTRNDPFWSSLDSSLSAAAAAPPQSAQPTAKRDLDVGLGDVARGVGTGALDLVGGIGELARQASNFGKENAGKQGGDYLEQARANMANKLSPLLDVVAGAGDLAASGAKSLYDGISADAKEALGRRLVDETPEGRLTLGDGAGDIDVWAMKMAQGVGSLLPTLAAGGVTGLAAKASIGRAVTASMVKRGATQKVAEAVAAKAVSKIATGASVTTGVTGSVGSAGVNTRDTVLGMSFDELSRSDTFRQAFTRIDQDQQTQHLSDEEKLSLAREETANVASRATMSDAKVWGVAAVGSMMGDAMLFKMLAGKAATGGVLKGAAKGAAGEWTGETLENGVQQYAINESLNKVAAADIDPMKGVVSSALEGGLIGIGTGGAVGAVGGARGGKHASQEDGVGTDPVSEPSSPVTEGAAGPAVDPNFASVPLEEGEQAPSASQAEGELNPLGPSASQFDELRDVPAYLRQDDTADRFKGMAADSEVQRALAGEFGQSVQELVASQMQAGDQGKSLYERAQAGELGLDPFAGNKSAQQVAMENQRLALPLKDVIFAGDANAKPKGEAVAAPGDHDDQQAGPGPQFRGGERTRWQSGQEGDVLPPESAGNPAGALPGRVIDGEAREVGTELPYKPFIAGQDNRAAVSEEQRRQAEQSAMAERQQNQPKQIGQSDTIFAPGAPGADNKNSAYTPPRLSRDQVDNSLGEQSTRDPRSPVAQSIEQAGSEQDSIFGQLKTLRITKRGKPFASQKEAKLASRKTETPIELPAGGFGVVDKAELEQVQASQVNQGSNETPGSDVGNGFKTGAYKGSKYRVSTTNSTGAENGTPILEKRMPSGSAATFYVGKDGNLLDADNVSFNDQSSKERVWRPASKEQTAEAASILDEMGKLDLNDPKRAELKVKLKALVLGEATSTIKPSMQAEASQLAPAIDTGYREVIPVKQPKTEVGNEPVTPVPAISSEGQRDQPGAGEPAAAGAGPAVAGLADRARSRNPADNTPAPPVPDGQQQNDPTLTAPATDAGAAVSGRIGEEELRDRDLLKEHGGHWKYRSAVGAGWFTANTKEAAIERAEEAYRKAVSKGEPVPTRDERFAQSETMRQGQGVNPPPPRTLDTDGRASDGKPINGGDTFATSSGRTTTPYPKQKGEKYASQWLINNATEEARARGDNFNAPIFSATTTMKNGSLTTADRDGMLSYLFGQQPAVLPPITRPLTAPASAPADGSMVSRITRAMVDKLGALDGATDEHIDLKVGKLLNTMDKTDVLASFPEYQNRHEDIPTYQRFKSASDKITKEWLIDAAKARRDGTEAEPEPTVQESSEASRYDGTPKGRKAYAKRLRLEAGASEIDRNELDRAYSQQKTTAKANTDALDRAIDALERGVRRSEGLEVVDGYKLSSDHVRKMNSEAAADNSLEARRFRSMVDKFLSGNMSAEDTGVFVADYVTLKSRQMAANKLAKPWIKDPIETMIAAYSRVNKEHKEKWLKKRREVYRSTLAKDAEFKEGEFLSWHQTMLASYKGAYDVDYLIPSEEAEFTAHTERLSKITTQAKDAVIDWRQATLHDYLNGTNTLFRGEMDFAEFKAMAEGLLANGKAVLAELNGMKKADVLDTMGYWGSARYKNEKKAEVVQAAYDQLLGNLRWAANGDSNSMSEVVSLGSKAPRLTIDQKVADALAGLTAERYQQFVNKQRADVAKRDAELAVTKEALRDPQTIEQFKTFLKYRSLDKLTPEQRARYEDLIAANNLDKRDQAREVKAATAVTPTASGDIIKTKHTKSGEDLYVVQMGDRVDRDTYNQINAHAKKLGGWYSSYKVGGAVPGFQFKDEAKATEFRGWLTGQGAASAAPSAEATPTEVTEPAQTDSKSKQVETLRTRAKTLRDKATAALNAERKENTNKRMTEAANARANAESELHFAGLLDAIADGIESGEVTYLRNLANGTQLTELNHALSRSLWNLPPARREALTSQGMIERTEDGRERWSAKATPEMMAEGAQMPGMDYFARNLKDVATKMQGASGFKQAGAKIMALVNAAINRDSKTVSITDPELIAKLKAYTSGVSDYDAKAVKEQIGGYSRLERMGITNHTELRAALRELARLQAGLKKQAVPRDPLAEKMVALKRKLVGNRNAFIDFFPTPESHAADLVALAGIEPGMTVLEPSAGHGMLAEAARAAGAKVDAVELAVDLREILQAKGFGLVGGDFMDTTPAQSYDAVVMNPPFSNDMDIDHVRHAYDHLKPGGRLVAIVSATAGDRQNNKNKAFREWFDGLGGSEQAMPDGAFKASLNPTDVRTKIFVIDKPANEVKPLPSPEGKRVTVATPKGQSVEVQYRVMEAADLVASHDFEGNINHDYPQQLQPRDRSKQTYRVQVGQIAAAPEGARLAASPETDRGAPIVRDGIVESGNGRTIGLKQAYQRGDAGAYRAYLLANATEFGLDAAAIEAMSAPVLVRERLTEMDDQQLRDFVVDSNTDAKMANSATEDARADAGKLTTQMLNMLNIPDGGDVLAAQNHHFLQAFLRAIGENQSNSYVNQSGGWNAEYGKRVKAAIFAYGYDNQRLLDAVTGETDEVGRNMIAALLNNAVAMAQLRQHSPERAKSLANYLAEAVESVVHNKRSGQSLQELAAQGDMLGGGPSTESSLLAQAMASNARSAKAMTEMIGDILAMMNKTPSNDMFGEAVTPITAEESIRETLRAIDAYNQQRNQTPRPSGDLFGLAAARNDHGTTPSVSGHRDGGATESAADQGLNAPKWAKEPKERHTVAGISFKVPVFDKELQKTFNEAVHRGEGRNFAQEIQTVANRLALDLEADGLLATHNQRVLASQLIESWVEREIDNAKKTMAYGIANPSWMVTGTSGNQFSKRRQKSNLELENERQADHEKAQEAAVKRMRAALKELQSPEAQRAEAFKLAWRDARAILRDLSSYLTQGKTALLAELRKSGAPKLAKLLGTMAESDPARYRSELRSQDQRFKEAGMPGLIELIGARTNAGKIISDAINGRIRFSKQAMAQGEKPAKHLTRKEAELVTKEWFKQYRGASGIDVQIHATQAELEKALGLAAQDGLIRRAAFDDDSGTLHVAADTIANPKRMREILRHEVLAHYGLANVLGDGEYTKLMSRLIASQKDPSMKPVWDWVNTHYADEDIGTKAEEVVAHLAELEQGAWGRGWDRVVAWVTRALRAVGFVPDGITAAETRSLIEGLGKKLQRSGPDDSGPDGGKKFSQEAERPAQKGGIKMSQASTAADAAMEKLNLGPKPDIIDKTKASLNKLRQVDRGVVSSWIDRVIKKANTEVLDALAPIKYAEEAAGITDAADSGYVAARMATGAASTMQATMLYGLPEWNDGVIQRKAGTGEKDALLGIFADLGADLHNWLGWMAGHRAELLMAQGRENLLDANDIAALKGQGKGKEAKFLDAKARWNRLNAATLDLAQEAGLFTKEARAEFESEWYIPFFRESDDGDVIAPFKTKGIANQNSGIKKLKGGEANTNDLLENIFTSTSKLIDASMKNMAAQKTVWNLADTGIIEVIPKPNKMDYQALANGKDRIMVKLEGEDYMIRVEDPDLYRAMTFFDRKPFGAMVNVAAKAKRLLTAGVTASPEFMLRNFLRDSLSSWAISKDGFRPVIDSIKGVKKTLAMDGSTIDVMFSGASFLGGYVNGNDPEAMADTVRKSLRRKGMTPEQIARYEKSIIRNAAQAKGVVANVWEKYNRYGEAFENANREAVYAAAIKAGKSHAQAAFESKDLMDFSMLGASRTMQVMTQLLPFFNARVQGLGKLTRELRDNPSAIAKRAGMITAASLALLAANWDDERYEELPDWDKDANWHFFVGDQHFRIPKPFEIGVLFGTIPERMVRALGDKDSGAQFGKAVARAIGDTFALNPIPQIAKPVVETTVNYDFFKGGPIDGPQDLNVQAEARYNEQTSLLMRELGELTGFSPKQLEHLVIGYTGTMGSYVMAAADGLIRASRPGESASWRADEIPLVKAVYRGTGPAKSTQHMEEFYRMLNEVNQLKRTIDQYRSEGLTDKARELLEEQGGILKSRRSLSRTQQQVRVVRNKIELIQRDRTLAAEEKRRRIDELLARRNDLVYQAVNKNKANWE